MNIEKLLLLIISFFIIIFVIVMHNSFKNEEPVLEEPALQEEITLQNELEKLHKSINYNEEDNKYYYKKIDVFVDEACLYDDQELILHYGQIGFDVCNFIREINPKNK